MIFARILSENSKRWIRLWFISAREAAAPQIVSAAFVGVRSEVLLHTLEERDIYVSAGSACSNIKKRKPDADSHRTAEESDGSNRTVQFL